MQLQFEHIQQIGAGQQPSAIHTPENIVQILFVGDGGRIYAMDASTPMGQWDSREFNPSYLVCTDVDIEHLKLKYVSAASIFAVWKNETEPPETGTVRHRLAVWAMRQDLSKFLSGGVIEMNENDPVVKVSLTFENPGQLVSNENDTILTPGASVTLFFRAGNSARYIMGRYFVDKNDMAATDSETSIVGRNGIGKFLKDQTWDEDNSYPLANFAVNLAAMLDSFGVDNYWIGPASANVGMEFPPDMDGLTGILEYLKTVRNWQMKEDLTGQIGIGARSDSRFTQPSTYTFNRGKDCFSRSVSRSDMDAYARVCVHTDDFAVQVYRDVDFRFTMARKKTLYVSVPANTTIADATEYADELAALVGEVGVIETFDGPFRPQLITGDNARIQAASTRMLGRITTIRHSFGKDGKGYHTEFVVDSGGTRGRVRLSDFIERISGRQQVSGQVKRLY